MSRLNAVSANTVFSFLVAVMVDGHWQKVGVISTPKNYDPAFSSDYELFDNIACAAIGNSIKWILSHDINHLPRGLDLDPINGSAYRIARF
jgi:hypothetical protein